jgi:DNA-binding Lrp family transcriptional regulator
MKLEELLERAKDLILNGTIKGYTSQMFEEAVKNDPVLFAELLDEVGQQVKDSDSHKQTVSIYGEELSGVALAFHMLKVAEEQGIQENFIRSLVYKKLRIL